MLQSKVRFIEHKEPESGHRCTFSGLVNGLFALSRDTPRSWTIARLSGPANTGIALGINIIKDPSGKTMMHIVFTDVFRYDTKHWVGVAAEETPVGK